MQYAREEYDGMHKLCFQLFRHSAVHGSNIRVDEQMEHYRASVTPIWSIRYCVYAAGAAMVLFSGALSMQARTEYDADGLE